MHQEEVRYKSTVGEALLLKLGAMLNFLSLRHVEVREMFINGVYNGVIPNIDVDGGIIFQYPVEIVNIFIKNRTAGDGGTTELDLQWKPQGSGSWASIFTTAPQIKPAAAASEMCGVGQTVTGFTAPVLGKTQFDAFDMLRLNINSAMSGMPTGCAIVIVYRPR